MRLTNVVFCTSREALVGTIISTLRRVNVAPSICVTPDKQTTGTENNNTNTTTNINIILMMMMMALTMTTTIIIIIGYR